jgi:autotransporter translocation and assembly factor TamB
MSPHPRLRHALRLTLKCLAFFVLAVVAIVATVLLAINLPPVNGWVAERINAALEPTFKGRLVLHRLGHLDFGGLSDAEIEVLDPAGKSVLVARDIDVRLFWPGVAWQAAVQQPEVLRVPIGRVELDEVDVTLIDDGNGTPTLASAFEPKQPPEEEEKSSGTAIVIDELAIATIRVRGALAAVGPIDTDLAGLQASLENNPGGTHVVLQRLAIDARQLPQVGTLTGNLTADVTLPAEPSPNAPKNAPQDAPVARNGANGSGTSTQIYGLSPAPVQHIVAGFDGAIAGSEAEADVELTGERLAATFEMAKLEPVTVTRLVPALAPSAPLSLSAKVDGLLSDLAFDARLAQQAAEIRARGKVARAGADSKITANVTAAKLDLSRLLPEGAKTDLNVGVDAALDLGTQGGSGTYHLASHNSRYADQALPPTTLEGKLDLPNEAPLAATGRVTISEPGAPTQLDYEVHSGDRGVVAVVSSMTRVDQPQRLREQSGARVSGEVASRARYDTVHDLVDAEMRVNLTDIRHPELKATRLDVSARARGRASAPDLELLANLTGVRAGNRTWSRVRVHALGTSDELDVRAQAYGKKPDKIDVRAVVAPGSEQLVRSPVIRINDSAGDLVIRAAGVQQTGERLKVDRLTIEGPGSATASLSYGRELERLKLDAKQLDAARVLRIVGVRSRLTSAKLDMEAEYEHGRQPRGKLVANVSDIGLGRLSGGTASADFVLQGGKLSGKADIELARGAKTHLAIDGIKSPFGDGPPPSLETLRGGIELSGDVDLTRLQPVLPFAGIERAAGRIIFDINVEPNPDRRSIPRFRAKLRSEKLVLVSERPDADQMPTADRAKGTSPWTLRGVDIDVEASLADQVAKIAAHVFDRRGDVLALNAEFHELGDLSNPKAALERAPFTARLSLPRRGFEQWPAPIRPAEIEGALTLQVDAEGTLTAPRVHARGRVDGFRAASDNPKLRRVDVELGARYETSGGDVMLRAHEKGKAVLGLDSRWTGDAAKMGAALSSPDGKSPLLADLKVKLEDFPLELVPELHNKHVAGNLSGKVELTGLGKDARLAVDLGSKRVAVDRLILSELRARVQSDGSELELESRIAGGGGSAEVRAKTALTWRDRLVPVVDQQRLEGSFTAKDFPLATLQPVVEGSVSDLEGKLDADIRAELAGGQPRLSGRAALDDGVLQLPAIGQRFSDISAKVEISPERVRISEVKARGVSGGFEAEAEAALRGLTPVSAKASISIDEDNKLPLTVEGESVGDAWGKIETQYRVDEANKQTLIAVDLKKFHLQLPAAPPQGIQALEQAEHVRVGYWRQDREFVTVPLQPLEEPAAPSEYQTIVTVDLGNLQLEKGDQVEVGVGGTITAKLGAELDVTGKLETKRGTLFIAGKSFEIERGTVTFTGGPPDTPIISAVARYDAPAGYTVYAEYTGTASEGKLNLRSEPPLSQDEILTLLMFGTPDGSFGAGSESSNQLSTVVSVAGSTAAQGLNRALSKVTDLDVSARVDTSTGAPRPELVLQLTPRVAARVTQALGEPAPGQSPDRTFVTLELRVASAWALSTMVGDRGATAFDVIWRRRY